MYFKKRKMVPRGVLPRNEYETKARRDRITDICDAIGRYNANNVPVPEEWLDEIEELNDNVGGMKSVGSEKCNHIKLQNTCYGLLSFINH